MEQPANQIVFDTSSGISREEQQEIVDGINAMAEASFRGSELAPEAAKIVPKKKGFLFPLLVNVSAIAILAAGFYMLSMFHGQNEQEIRNSSVNLGLTENKLIEEIRRGSSPAAEELARLSDERELSARIGNLVSGFFTSAKKQIDEGRFSDASASLNEMRDFLNAPNVKNVRSMEAGRQSYLTAIDALDKALQDAIRFKSEASPEGGAALGEALDDLNARYAALAQESATLSAQGSAQGMTIAEKDARIKQLETVTAGQQATLSNQQATLNSLQTTLNSQRTEISTLKNERVEKELQISALNVSLSEQTSLKDSLQRQLNDLQRQLSDLKSQYTSLQTQYADLQQKLDAAMKLFQ